MTRIDENRLVDLLIKWNKSLLHGKPLGPDQLCPDNAELREALRARIDQLLAIEGTIEALNAADADRKSSSTLDFNSHAHFQRGQLEIVPRGIRSFGPRDADFYPSLLAGPVNDSGLPESIAFWKRSLEQRTEDKTFAIGVLSGPSGCGKSSLIRAGLIPSLAKRILTIYVEASTTETELRLLSSLRRHHPGIAQDLDLNATLISLHTLFHRSSVGTSNAGLIESGSVDQKTVIILDQFERWLIANQDPDTWSSSSLVQSLKQCNSHQIQCLLIVRDDFWTMTTHFLRELGERLTDGFNSEILEPFPSDHARHVLDAFGRAFGALPHSKKDLSVGQVEFLDESIKGLAEHCKVLPARLALYAETMKGRPWVPATLGHVVGAEEIGVSYLETCLGSKTAPPEHRRHLHAACRVLQRFLLSCESGVVSKSLSYTELLEASGYKERLVDFEELLRILDNELRLITPADTNREAQGKDEAPSERLSRCNTQVSDSEEASPSQAVFPLTTTNETLLRDNVLSPNNTAASFAHDNSTLPIDASLHRYQLTHDLLIPVLREWIERKRSETIRGRAELRLEERVGKWMTRNDSRLLPTIPEYFDIQVFTKHRDWTPVQRQMMIRATLFHGIRWLRIITLVLSFGFSIYLARNIILNRQVQTTFDAIQNSTPDDFYRALDELKQLPREVALKELLTRRRITNGANRLRVECSLAELGVVDTKFLCSLVESVPAEESGNLIEALSHDRAASLEELQRIAAKHVGANDWLLAGRFALVALYLGDSSKASDLCRINDRPDPTRRACFIEAMIIWAGDIAKLASFARSTDDVGLRSAICLALSEIDREQISDFARTSWIRVLAEWHQSAPDALTHSSAELTIYLWGLEPNAIKSETKGDDWQVNSTGIVLVRVAQKPGTSQAIHTLTDQPASFLVSDREISIGQFQKFLDDANCPNSEKPTVPPTFSATEPSFPVNGVSWYDAVLYCNWLSRQEHLQPCYERTGAVDASGNDEWRRVPSATGYRLPTEIEWEYACRAGTATPYSCGDGFLLTRFANVVGSGLSPCALRFPNGWGLFDMHGNLAEWCDQTTSTDRIDDIIKYRSMTRGGAWSSPVSNTTSSFSEQRDPSNRTEDVGFRIVRITQ